ncbi:helix-turn-helix domain-containing protein [Nocardia huaxiensis]|uniref:Helix-turn-helix domain-containing protein n=1 Tax=Nocardia huaxiensis TaxID=2755382 RepID=A0A7D6Z2H2_9NOCA|nr:helix-turn-helix transcriptional regulator [Nocardia huaxiensis]QLY29224.1 helix-turn-helix domain-containing protein [Nocardia huaxiensis]UFS97275.1 helix-turn-helix domain-containing protein [Nocardia huaxiensis]
MVDEDSTLPRRQLGRFLRQSRDEVGLTLVQAAKIVEIGTTSLHRLEKGAADKVRVRIIKHLCEIYERSPEETAAAVRLAEQAAVKTWYQDYSDILPDNFDDYVGLEAVAQQLVSYQELVPGLLQTPDYARTMMRNYFVEESPEDVERRVALRMKRQTIVKRKTAPVVLDVVLHESALRRAVGSPKIMANQLRHLADASTWPNVEVRVLPFAAGIPMGMLPGPFVVLDFGIDGKGRPVEPTVVYIESVITANLYLQKESDVERYRSVSAALHRSSLNPLETRALLRQVAKEYQL